MVNCKWATFAVSVILTMTLLAASGDLNANETLRNAAKHQNQLWRLLKNLGQRRTNIQLSSKLFDRLPTNVEKTYTPPQLIANRGYRVETHKVTTDDGYIIELHRIPSTGTAKKAVFLQHGVLNTSGNWMLTPTSRSLPFILADKGYDVWLGNFRGNRYSRAHVTLDPNGAEFWKFSWDEIGRYDIPASINYVLAKTGNTKLNYIGHSLGSGSFFIAMIVHPELNSKIDLMIALAPLSSFNNFRSFIKIIFPFQRLIRTAVDLVGTRVFLDNDFDRSGVSRLLCEQTYKQARNCIKAMNTVGGPSTHLDPVLMPQVNANFFSGTSANVMAQFAQNYNAGEVFQKFDYGRRENLRRYGTPKPPEYDLNKVTAPVYVFWGSNDYIVAPKDVQWLLARLGNLKGSTEIQGYAHGDFLWADDINDKLHNNILALLPAP